MESRDHKTIRYILRDDDLLFLTGCEWLSERHVDGLIPCTRSVQNGRTRLTYEIGDLSALSDCLPSLSTQLCLHVVQDLLHSISNVSRVGFLRRELISLNPERIFIDPRDHAIHLIYLPLVVERDESDLLMFEKNLSGLFDQILSIHPRLKEEPELFGVRSALSGPSPDSSHVSGSADAGRFLSPIMSSDQESVTCENNQNDSTGERVDYNRAPAPLTFSRLLIGGLSLIGVVAISVLILFKVPIADRPRVFLAIGTIVTTCVITVLFVFFRSKKRTLIASTKTRAVEPSLHFQGGEKTELLDNFHGPRLILSAIDLAEPFHVLLDNDESVLGKDRLACDAVIHFNPAISRRHCKVTRRGVEHYIVDLNSSNGTYVNDVRLSPHREQSIRVGDQIKLANSRFILKSRPAQNDIIKNQRYEA